jgi:DNA processing protein
MQASHIRAWLALHRTPRLSQRKLLRLINVVDSPDAVFQLSSEQFTELGIPAGVANSLHQYTNAASTRLHQQIEQDLQILKQQSITLLPITSPDYPELLKQIDDPPPLLYIKGNVDLLNQPQIAMVGSRRASRQALENAMGFARELAKKGFTITSGMALGIDAYSHAGALAGSGNTVAVLGTGLDIIYPRRNQSLYEQISQQGVLVSEFALGSGPRPHSFPRRNRIISGMSLGVLVVEAALQSGSLITARLALEQNREVFAIPSSIHNLGGKGCNALLRQGAKLVETVSDILEEMTGWLPVVEEPREQVDNHGNNQLDEKERRLLQWLCFDPEPIDWLQQLSGWPLSELSATLTSLEIKGLIESKGGCYQRLATCKF